MTKQTNLLKTAASQLTFHPASYLPSRWQSGQFATRLSGWFVLQVAVATMLLVASALAETKHGRVLAIGGAVTEIIYALGEEDRLVGRDTTSTFPEAATALPDVGYIRALSPEGVLSVKPDLVLARENNGPPEAVEVLKSTGLRWVDVPDDFTIEGILENVRVVADELGVPEKGKALQAKIKSELDAVAKTLSGIEKPARVMFILSMADNRIHTAGKNTAADGIISLAGSQNVISEFEGYKQISNEAAIEAAPEVLIMMDRTGRPGGDHGMANEELAAHPALAATDAIKDDRIIRMDGLLMLGFGPRTAEGAFKLAKDIYGDELN